jgi:alkylation response protein AidB-like acyl-CoA dehydrogenase
MSDIYNKMVEFSKNEILPHTNDVDALAQFPTASFEAIKREKITGLVVPKEFGGMGLGLEEHTQTVLAFGSTCATTGLCYMMHNVATMCIVAYGTEQMKNEYLPKIAKGEIVLALAFSETGTGTHFYNPEISVTKENNSLVMNGRKSFVTSALYADFYLVLSNSAEAEGLDNWIIGKNFEGITFEETAWDGLGMRGNASMPMLFSNVKVSEANRVGPSGSGAEQVFNVVAPFFVIGLSAVYTGVALNACNTIIQYSMHRKYSDESALCNIPTVQNHIAEIFTKANSAKHYTLAAAKSGANGDADALAQIISARLNASDMAVEVCHKAMKIGGGTAYAKRITIERLLRDAYAAQVMAPSTDVLSIWLGKALTNQPIP